MLRLLLLRHAKSDWGHPGLPDHDRPLNARGRREAARMGRWLREHGLVPAGALVSTARRTTETAGLVLGAALGAAAEESGKELPPSAQRLPGLYGASPHRIVQIVRREGGAVSPLLVVGHNPGMQGLAGWFRGRWRRFPTAALLVAAVEADRWAELNPTRAVTVEHFLRPGDLPPSA